MAKFRGIVFLEVTCLCCILFCVNTCSKCQAEDARGQILRVSVYMTAHCESRRVLASASICGFASVIAPNGRVGDSSNEEVPDSTAYDSVGGAESLVRE